MPRRRDPHLWTPWTVRPLDLWPRGAIEHLPPTPDTSRPASDLDSPDAAPSENGPPSADAT